eukprot:Phypoly_transcript_19432.p1 GENE.Phypoly_transcript_19432~~Phypoly_transcript_19432.p1  ORF type:complete len:237 (+),score=47.67 Phypoly_transcript_19432:1-711(+)
MNNEVALIAIIEQGQKSISNLMKLLFTSKNTRMKSHLMELMAAMALYSHAGYDLILRCLNKVERKRGGKKKFELFVKLIRDAPEAIFRSSCIALVNCFVSACPELEERQSMREHFINVGFIYALDKVKEEEEKAEEPNEELALQIRVFEEHMDADEAEIAKIEGHLKLRLDDPKSLLAEIEKNSSDTKQLAELMQVLLMIPFHDHDAAESMLENVVKAAHYVVNVKKSTEDPGIYK